MEGVVKRPFIRAAVVSLVVLALGPTLVHAQFNGHNTKGDFGLLSGSQAPPGFYLAAPIYVRYDADTLRNREGDPVRLDPERRGSLAVNAYVVGLIWVSEFKIFGANYGIQAYPGFTDNVLEVPILGTNDSVSTGFTDLYIQPINLGWHTKRADFIAGLGIFAPTGHYEPAGDENLGLGMWSFEVFGGTTVFLDKAKSWHFAATAFYETHTDKKDTNVRVGDLLTVEGGLGWSFLQGLGNVGVAYYAQWKATNDDLGVDLELPPELRVGKHRVYGIGPEVTIPIATKRKLIGFVNARYLWETGARTTTEGSTFVLTATFPLPSIPLQ
jgi:hypothetical protein